MLKSVGWLPGLESVCVFFLAVKYNVTWTKQSLSITYKTLDKMEAWLVSKFHLSAADTTAASASDPAPDCEIRPPAVKHTVHTNVP